MELHQLNYNEKATLQIKFKIHLTYAGIFKKLDNLQGLHFPFHWFPIFSNHEIIES